MIPDIEDYSLNNIASMKWKHHNLDDYKTEYEDFYVDEFGHTIYEAIRGGTGVYIYKILIRREARYRRCWAYFYYQTAGHGFKEFHKFRVDDLVRGSDGLTIDIGRIIFDRVFSFYLKLK